MFKVNAAVIGAGFMGSAHTEALRRIDVPVIGICGVDKNESEKAAEMLGIPKAYACVDDMLKDLDVHSVHLTTPNRFHYAMTKAALQAGKHVLCEKPLAMTTNETRDLIGIAGQSNLTAAVNYNLRFYPLCMEAKERISRGDIGTIYSITGSYVQDWLLYPTDYNWRVLTEEGGAARAIGDIGSHWMDLVQHISGLNILKVFADLKTVHPVRKRPKGEVKTFSGKLSEIQATEKVDIHTEDCGSVLMRFDNGASGNLWVSQTTAGRKNCLRFEIAGSEKTLYWNSESPNEMWIGERNQPNQMIVKDPGLLSESVRSYTGYPGGHNEGYPDTLKHCFLAFYTHIAGKTLNAASQFATFEEGHREAALCEAILKSNQEKHWITV
ncbi:Gfo/Idh/MocA family oxidoreductase [bacterium]|nr:Gfo/Idh/MocA family oxidoreductase [bacterium]